MLTTPDPGYRRLICQLGQRVVDGCADRLKEEELAPLRLRLDALEKLMKPSDAENHVQIT